MLTWGRSHWLVQGCCLTKEMPLLHDVEYGRSAISLTVAHQQIRLVVNSVVPCLHGKLAFPFSLLLMLRLLAFRSGSIIPIDCQLILL